MLLATATLLGLVLRGAACTGDHLHARDGHVHEYLERREYPQVSIAPPYRPLVWGDLNVIHTTDTHGWLLGHQKLSWAEPYYRLVFTAKLSRATITQPSPCAICSGDLGDFSSFVTHMKQIAIVCPSV
jgi:2',3'-cyclic-nucleotide 2'-phosphodiesterase (5'-nucleotidase family)